MKLPVQFDYCDPSSAITDMPEGSLSYGPPGKAQDWDFPPRYPPRIGLKGAIWEPMRVAQGIPRWVSWFSEPLHVREAWTLADQAFASMDSGMPVVQWCWAWNPLRGLPLQKKPSLIQVALAFVPLTAFASETEAKDYHLPNLHLIEGWNL